MNLRIFPGVTHRLVSLETMKHLTFEKSHLLKEPKKKYTWLAKKKLSSISQRKIFCVLDTPAQRMNSTAKVYPSDQLCSGSLSLTSVFLETVHTLGRISN